jgi:hypothetical protein
MSVWEGCFGGLVEEVEGVFYGWMKECWMVDLDVRNGYL